MVTLSQSMSQSECSVSDLELDPDSLMESMGLDDDFLASGAIFAPPFSSTLDEESLVAGFSMAESANQAVDDDKAMMICGEQVQQANCDDPRQLGDDWPLGHLETDLRCQSRQETSLPTRFKGRVEQNINNCITTNDCVYRQDHSYIVSLSEDPLSSDQSDSDIGSIFEVVTSSMDHVEQKTFPPSGLMSSISDHEHGNTDPCVDEKDKLKICIEFAVDDSQRPLWQNIRVRYTSW